MSKKPAKRRSKDLTYTPSRNLPKLKYQSTWDLKAHFYTSEKDPRIEKDFATVERAYQAFAKKYKNKDFTKNAATLKRALSDFEAHCGGPAVLGGKIMRYFFLRSALNAKDVTAQKKQNLYAERLRKLSNETIFFELRIGTIPAKLQKQYLKDPHLAHFRYYLTQIFETAKHQLTELEERIARLHNATSSDMWEDATERIISNRTIIWHGKTLTLPQALERIDEETPKNKQRLWELILTQMEQIAEFAEHELTAIVSHSKLHDELRDYKKPYSATVMSYENTEASVEALIAAISKSGFTLSKRFYKAKAAALGVKEIPYVNKYDSLGTPPTLSFDNALAICRDTFYGVKEEYGEIFDRLLRDGQTDIWPRAGKQGGAFLAASTGLPSLVMLNHTNTMKALETLAHEMGHAVHAERSRAQGVLYDRYSTTTAETASTLFEQLVTERVLEQLTPEQQLPFLNDKIGRDIATIQRQIAFFNFELAMHEHIRTQGAATKEELATLMERHLKSYLGPAVQITPRDGYSYVYVPHIRFGFYVYTYAYGALVSNLMAQKLKADPNYIEAIDAFLCAGGSDTVDNIFKAAAIDTTKVETFMQSLKTLEGEIKQFEKLTRART